MKEKFNQKHTAIFNKMLSLSSDLKDALVEIAPYVSEDVFPIEIDEYREVISIDPKAEMFRIREDDIDEEYNNEITHFDVCILKKIADEIFININE